MIKVVARNVVDNRNKFLSENLDVINDIPNPSINIAINPT